MHSLNQKFVDKFGKSPLEDIVFNTNYQQAYQAITALAIALESIQVSKNTPGMEKFAQRIEFEQAHKAFIEQQVGHFPDEIAQTKASWAQTARDYRTTQQLNKQIAREVAARQRAEQQAALEAAARQQEVAARQAIEQRAAQAATAYAAEIAHLHVLLAQQNTTATGPDATSSSTIHQQQLVLPRNTQFLATGGIQTHSSQKKRAASPGIQSQIGTNHTTAESIDPASSTPPQLKKEN